VEKGVKNIISFDFLKKNKSAQKHTDFFETGHNSDLSYKNPTTDSSNLRKISPKTKRVECPPPLGTKRGFFSQVK